MAGLSDIHVIETLDSYGFTRMDVTPWRGGNPEDWDSYPVDINDLPDFGRRRDDQLAPQNDLGAGGWERVAERINEASRGPAEPPPPGSVDALAWYLPFHYFGPNWGIYVKEEEVLRFARLIKSRLGGPPSGLLESQQLIRAAFSILYLHEAFHHKVESFATRLEISRVARVYIPYDEHVYRPLAGTDDQIEEAFACAEMLTRFKAEKSFHGSVDRAIKNATVTLLRQWIPTLPPAYRRGLDFASSHHVGELLSQVAEQDPIPRQPHLDWDIASHMTRGLFHKHAVAHVIVPIGTTPIIPWLGVHRYLSISTRKAERHITKEFGYYDTGRGKGSHRHFHSPGRPPITLPSNRESLSPTVQRQIASALGYSSIRELAQHC
jgi:hypothetical protein